jgi:hypothetical protein
MGEGRVLSLDEFATVTARLEAGAPRDRVLTEAELTADEWLAAQAMWLERMAKLAAKGRPQLHERFLERLEAQRAVEEKRKAEPRPLEGDMPRPPEPVVSAVGRLRPTARKPVPSVAPQPVAPREFFAAAPGVAVAPPAARPATSMFAAIPSAAALPFAPVDTEPAPESRTLDDAALPFRPPSHAPAAPSEPPGVPRAGHDALPFRSASSAPPAPFAPPAVPRAAPNDGALPFRSASSAPPALRPPSDGALPFRNTRSEVPIPPNAPQGPSSFPASQPPPPPPDAPVPSVAAPSSVGSAMPSGGARRASLSATTSLPAMSPAEAAALPFAGSAASPRSATGRQAGGLPFAPPPATKAPAAMAPAGQGGLPFGPRGTATERQAMVAGDMPFSPVATTLATSEDASATPADGSGSDGPKMTVEQYAWLCSAIAKAPDRAAATLGWMKLTAADKEAIDRHFEEVFRKDSSARARFFEAMAAREKG